ncbi:MAG: IS1595 family transposase [Acidobacteriota bacterium]|nr:IS1595 family transposase [Acidobacteriota bacterium]
MESPRTLQDAIRHFSDYENCKQFMINLRWPDGTVRCPHCGSDHVTYLDKARVWKCYSKHDRPRFSLKTGTIFEDSPISLDKWLTAAWLIVNCRNGISSYEVHRDIRITQKSAWFMDHRIRFALHSGSFEKMLSGEVEADETFIGGKARNMHKEKRVEKITGTGGKDKAMVFGILQRGGKIRTKVVENRKKKSLQAEVREHVEAGSALYTDALKSYEGLDEFEHQVVDHAVEYVRGQVHTNGLENFWSLVKRGLNGTYVSVEPFHLFRYLDEQAFRYNNRKGDAGEKVTDFDRFKMAMSQIVGKRLTWKQLTGKLPEPETCVN